MQRDFSPLNQRNVYDPWGRSGAGAPIKNSDGQIQTRTAGRVTHDSSVRMFDVTVWNERACSIIITIIFNIIIICLISIYCLFVDWFTLDEEKETGSDNQGVVWGISMSLDLFLALGGKGSHRC